MRKEEVKHWFLTILVDLIIAAAAVAISVRYTNKRLDGFNPKLDKIIQLLEDNAKVNENQQSGN